MVRLSLFLGQRVRRLNRRRTKKGRRYILCWLQQALRAHDNPIVDVAVYAGNELGLPVVVHHGLDNRYPYASHRLHRFILQASQSLERDLQNRRIAFYRYVRRAAKREPSLVYRLAEDAAMLITDDMPTFVARSQSDSVAKKAMLPVWAVDTACAVPTKLSPYFHFGVLGPRETVNWGQEAELHTAARWKFFDETIRVAVPTGQ